MITDAAPDDYYRPSASRAHGPKPPAAVDRRIKKAAAALVPIAGCDATATVDGLWLAAGRYSLPA
jgi:hypothetical protein